MLNVKLVDIENGVKELIINNKLVGKFILDVDGYYYYWPESSLSGSWNSNALRIIADKLDEVNLNWDKHITKYFSNESL